MKNKTAVQWLEEQLYKSGWDNLTHEEKMNICATAKLMEMEQIMDALDYGFESIDQDDFINYYKKTYR